MFWVGPEHGPVGWDFLTQLYPFWDVLTAMFKRRISRRFLAPGFFTQFPMVPRLGQNLLAYLASWLPTNYPWYSGPPGAFLRKIQRRARRPELFLPTYRLCSPYTGGVTRVRTCGHVWANGKWLLCLHALPPTLLRWLTLLLPRSIIGTTRAQDARHLFICSWDFSDPRPGDQFLTWYHVKYSGPPPSCTIRSVLTGFRLHVPLHLLLAGADIMFYSPV
ncbi:hypothetical protein CSUI_009883 [Cystoisospora suis]|uniref:Uncharacterized protein n=1 Tax=Cystoisospora suis TaxID=483139 RepID=A0A2C6KIT6_9APIC|nr:hypothetical protein CSUI_009883 [Cystoisospora suis]